MGMELQWHERGIAELPDTVQQAWVEASQWMRLGNYPVAADAFIDILQEASLPLTRSLAIRLQAVRCLLLALINGQFDTRLRPTALSVLTESNWVLDQAELLLVEYRRLAPESCCASLYLSLATIQKMQRRYHQALDSLQEALTFATDSAEVHFEYAQTCVILGLTAAAREHFHLAHLAAPDDPLIARSYVRSLEKR